MLDKGFGILTDRRFYFKGKCYHKTEKGLTKTNEERIVDLQDITSSGFTYTRNVLWLVLSIIGLGWAIFASAMLMFESGSRGLGYMFAYSWFPDIILWLIYTLSQIVIYEVSFAGGGIAVKASSYGVKELRDFDKKVKTCER